MTVKFNPETIAPVWARPGVRVVRDGVPGIITECRLAWQDPPSQNPWRYYDTHLVEVFITEADGTGDWYEANDKSDYIIPGCHKCRDEGTCRRCDDSCCESCADPNTDGGVFDEGIEVFSHHWLHHDKACKLYAGGDEE